MPNIGEEIVGTYIRECLDCDFVDYNVETRGEQGEIDVIGINLKEKKAYVCEVVTHLTTGIQYVKDRRPDTYKRLVNKFKKDINYGKKFLKGFKISYMLWTPIVKHSSNIIYNQFESIRKVQEDIFKEFKVKLEIISNELYQEKLNELRAVAKNKTSASNLNVLRYLQIEEHLKKHLKNLEKINKKMKFKRSKT